MLPDARGSQIFVNFGDNANLDEQGFAPFAQLKGDVSAALDALGKCYVEKAKIDQGMAKEAGASYFDTFPNLSYWESAQKL